MKVVGSLHSPNLLPAQGDVRYYTSFFAQPESEHYLQRLTATLAWKHEAILMFGKKIMQPRLTAWYGDAEAEYKYSGIRFTPLPWTPELRAIKEKVEHASRANYNSALVNLYRDQSDSMGWHQDNEKELGPNPTIASVSFGAIRTFRLRHVGRAYSPLAIELQNGGLLLMSGETQHHWSHCIPKSRRPMSPRINITFRWVY